MLRFALGQIRTRHAVDRQNLSGDERAMAAGEKRIMSASLKFTPSPSCERSFSAETFRFVRPTGMFDRSRRLMIRFRRTLASIRAA